MPKPPQGHYKEAFVAMKFSGNSWNDKRYHSIAEVLREAGYEPVRADEIEGSGQVVEEVCRHLKNAPLVVIDSTGDSHSVSYEIGYCHGVGRKAQNTILIRRGQGNDIPFNFRHFRHCCYKSSRQLKHLLRVSLGRSTPLTDAQYGYVFVFCVPIGTVDYAQIVKKTALDTLSYFDFTGRCELYEEDLHLEGEHCFRVALGLKFPRKLKPAPNYQWWMKFSEKFGSSVEQRTPLKVADAMSELGTMGAIRYDKRPCGIYGFHQGRNFKFIRPDELQREASALDYLSQHHLETSLGEDLEKD